MKLRNRDAEQDVRDGVLCASIYVKPQNTGLLHGDGMLILVATAGWQWAIVDDHRGPFAGDRMSHVITVVWVTWVCTLVNAVELIHNSCHLFSPSWVQDSMSDGWVSRWMDGWVGRWIGGWLGE